jgi:anti-anti-sigma factor
VTRDGSVATIAIHGEIDVSSAHVLAGAVVEARTAGCTELVVDLGGVSFMDLSGIRVLHLAATDGASVVLRQPSRLVRRVVDLAGMAGVLAVEDDDEVRGSGRD